MCIRMYVYAHTDSDLILILTEMSKWFQVTVVKNRKSNLFSEEWVQKYFMKGVNF